MRLGTATIADTILVGASVLILPSFLFSKAITSVCLGLFVIAGALYPLNDGRISTHRSYHGLLLTLVFGVSLLSGWNSTDTSEWIHILILRLPFVLLPLAFWVMPDQSTDRLVRVHLHLLLVLVVAAIPQLFFFFHHLDTHLEMLSRGQPISTPIEHVKYSMINAYGVISSAYFLSKRESISARLRPYIIGGSLLLFVFMHLLAVRTGLGICYVSIMALYGWQYLKSGSYIRFIALFTGILALAVTAYSVVPSIKHKVHYMLYDWRMWSENGGVSYADSERIISFRAALQVWLDHPWWGVGAGDVRETLLGPEGPLYLLQKLPHNQFLLTLTGSGLIGLLLFTIGFYGLLWSRNMTHRGLLLLLYLNYTLSFMVENSLERSVTTAFFLFFAMWIALVTTPDGQTNTAYHQDWRKAD